MLDRFAVIGATLFIFAGMLTGCNEFQPIHLENSDATQIPGRAAAEIPAGCSAGCGVGGSGDNDNPRGPDAGRDNRPSVSAGHSNASGNNMRGGNYDRVGHEDNGKGKGRE